MRRGKKKIQRKKLRNYVYEREVRVNFKQWGRRREKLVRESKYIKKERNKIRRGRGVIGEIKKKAQQRNTKKA